MNRLLIFILAALSMLGALSIDAYLPGLPAITREFMTTPAAAQQSLTAYLLGFAIMTLFYGTLSDSFGRRPVILGALLFYLLSSAGAALATSLEMLVFFRVLQGLTAGAGGVVGRAMVGDLFTGAEAHKAMSWISVVFGLAPAIAPIVGGWLQATHGWRSIFHFIALFSLLLLALCWARLPESLPRARRQPFRLRVILANYGQVARHARFMLCSLAAALMFSGVLLYVAAAPAYVMEVLHRAETDFAWLFIPLIGGMTLGSFASGKLSHRLAPGKLVSLCFLLMLAAAAGNMAYTYFFAPAIPWVLVPLALYSFGAAAAMPAMTLMALEMFPQVRGLAASMQSFLFMALFALESAFVAPLLAGSAFPFALATGISAVLGLLCWSLSAPRQTVLVPHPTMEDEPGQLIPNG